MPHIRLGGPVRAIACLLALTSGTRAVLAAQTSSTPEHLTADTPKQTVAGASFIAPADWTFSVHGPATILTAPEGDSRIALVDVRAPTAVSAVALAWAAYLPGHTWPLKVVTPQNGKVVVADGFGVRELGKPGKPDANTLFMVASNTKALTTLMLAKLVEAHRFGWETPVTSLLPSFKLGDTAITRQVLVKHLICACTGLPRQALEWLFAFKDATPESALRTLGTMQPTSKFGEMFQYSNPMAAAAGYTGGHVAFPDLELGAAYDKAMRTFVFDPLGMTSTTFDYATALAGNHASPHAPDIDGKASVAAMDINYSVIPVRPAGAAWSSVRDMLKYISMELAEGRLPDGTQYIRRETLLARRAPQVPIGKEATYGMGLMVDTKYGTPVVHHGGDMIGFHSDMMWLPEYDVGAVVLTNGNPGWVLRTVFRRKLLEVLFDGRDEADADVASQAKSYYAQLAADRKLLTVPADTAVKLARHFHNDALGDIDVRRAGGRTVFDFGEFRSEVAT